MKIYLINPPSDFLISERSLLPISILYIYSMLKKHNYDVHMIDLAGVKQSDWQIPLDGDIYGITATTPHYVVACHLASIVKKSTNIVVLGGAHGTILPRETLESSQFDIVCLREGEQTMLEIVEGRPLKNILGLAYKENGQVTINPHRPPLDIDTLPHFLVDDIDYKSYKLYIFTTRGNPLVTGCPILTSRGCPHNCAFCCSRIVNGKKVRYHSEKYISEFVDYLRDRGYENFALCDDNIIVNKRHTTIVCKVMSERNALWRAQVRGDMLTSELATQLYQGGCRQVDIGVETGSQRLLDLLNKGEQVEDNGNAVLIAQAAGIKVKTYMMVGLPSEKQEDINMSIDFINKYRPDGVTIHTFTPYPGCSIAENPSAYGYEIDPEIPFSKYNTINSNKSAGAVTIQEVRERTAMYSQQLVKAVQEVTNYTGDVAEARQKLI